MTHTTNTLLAIDSAIRAAGGDYHATKRATARFCTESLVDAAESCAASMSEAHRARYISSSGIESISYRSDKREIALTVLCGWVSCQRVIAFGLELDRARAAAQLEFPFAIAELGAAL